MQQIDEHEARPRTKTPPALYDTGKTSPALMSRIGDQVLGSTSRGVRNVLRSPVRLALVAAILGISLMFVAVMVALNASVQQRLADAQAQIGTGITISTVNAPGSDSNGTQYITADQVKTIENTKGVTSLSEYITTRDTGGTIKGSVAVPTNVPTFNGNPSSGGSSSGGKFFIGGAVDGTIPPNIEGLLPGQSPLTLSSGVTATIKSGRNFTTKDATSDVAITSEAVAKANNWKVGSTITLNGTKVTLVGLYSSGDSFNDNSIIVPFQTAQKIYSISGATGVTAYADTVADVDTVASSLRTALGSSLQVTAQSQIYTDIISGLQTTQKTIETTLWISTAVAALVIIFAVFLIVRERTQEIGLMRAIGASRGQIVGQFAVETLTLGVAAAAAATVLIALFAGTIARQFTTTGSNGGGANANGGGRIFINGGAGAGAFRVGGGGLGGLASQTLSAGLTPTTVLLVFALGIGLAILASVIPAWYVTRVRPATALRTVG